MGNNQSSNISYISFEDVQICWKNPEVYLLINTFPINDQGCLILNTVSHLHEENIINRHLNNSGGVKIVIYGKNSSDETVHKKYSQLQNLGFSNVHVYLGGLFEWLLLQDIYGTEDFPTTSKQLDILKYKPYKKLDIGLITN